MPKGGGTDPARNAIRRAGTPPARGSAAGSTLARVFTDSEDHALVQERLGLAYGLFASILGGFWLLGAAATAVLAPARFWAITLSFSKLAHLIGVFLLVATWLVCRGPLRSRSMLSVVDAVCAFVVSLIAALVIGFAPPGMRTEMMGSAILLLVVALRAAVVPSPPRWTAFVSAFASLPVPLGAAAAVMRDTSWPTELMPRASIVVFSCGWCVAGTVTAWAISHVVYGLRAEVKSATRLGQYTLEEKIGEGGMGAVYRARHALLRRPTAIKLLSPEHAAGANVQRFEREVQLTSRLTHPNTIAIYDFGHTRDGIFYYAMELLEGLSLHDVCELDGPQPPGRVLHIMAQAASALAEAHDIGLIHRDVKPANILLCERGGVPDFVKVLDFGLVKEVDSSDPALSAANAIAGTPLYMAPESITRPTEVDARVDIYALGAVGYWLLTAEPPFAGANLVEICSHHLHSKPVPPSERLGRPVPPAMEALIMKCLAKSPDERPANARELAAAVRELARDHAWTEDHARAWWRALGPAEKRRAHHAAA